MAGDLVVSDTDGAANGKPNALIKTKGTATTFQTKFVPGTTITKSAVRGAENLKGVYIQKKVAGKLQVEVCDFDKLNAQIALGWKLSGASAFRKRGFNLMAAAAGSSGGRKVYCQLVSDLAIGWTMQKTQYDAVPAATHTFMGHVDSVTKKEEIVYGGNFYAFKESFGDYPAGTLLPRKALVASVRFADPTDTSSGVHTSYCKGDAVQPV